MSITFLFTRAPPFCLLLSSVHVCWGMILFITLEHTCTKLGHLFLTKTQSLVPPTLLNCVCVLYCEFRDLLAPRDDIHLSFERLTFLDQDLETRAKSYKFAVCLANLRWDNGRCCLVA